MQGGGVEIGAVGPYEGVDLRIERNLAEHSRIAQRAIEFAAQHGLEIDHLLGLVVETDTQRVDVDDLKVQNAAKQMGHWLPCLF